MNDNQKLLTVAALGVLVLTLVFVRWEETNTSAGHPLHTVKEKIAPVFWPPERESYPTRLRLRSEVLLVEWAAIGLIYAGLFFCFKTSQPKQP